MKEASILLTRQQLGSSMLPAVAVEAGCSEALTRELRAAASAARFDRFDLAHWGRYDVSNDEPPRDALAALVGVAAACVGTPLERVMHRWVRLGRGDYALVRDDRARFERLSPHGYDVVVDLSETASGEAEIVFTHRGQAFFTMPQRPREIAFVRRGPTVQRYARYLTHRVGDRSVLRLELGLVPRKDALGAA